MPGIHVIGAGLAGSEAALQLAERGFRVKLYDMKPEQRSPAHHSGDFAEIVCSNSFGSQSTPPSFSASGLLKDELEMLDCQLLRVARMLSLPAGKALAVDRERFAAQVTKMLRAHPNIECIARNVESLPSDGLTLVATGPLTSPELSEALARLLERNQLYFFDAASPIIVRDSIDFNIAFYQDRYSEPTDSDPAHDETAPAGSYINCPLEKSHYEALVDILLHGEKTPLKSFEAESACYFESCLPVEVLASRGHETLRYGPMKPVGIRDPRTGRRPYAVVQLRQDNTEASLYNMVGFQTNLKWGTQKDMIHLIPGLENAEVVRYGVMHRNTFIHSPETLLPTLQLKKHGRILIAGQLTGTEGYTESIACGLMAALNICRLATGQEPVTLPRETMLGALLGYITRPEAAGTSFQPINSNWGILPELPPGAFPKKDKATRNRLYAERSRDSLSAWMSQHQDLFQAGACLTYTNSS